MKLAAICDHDTAVGLQLAGVHEISIPAGDPILSLDQIIQRSDIGVVFVTEKIAKNMGKQLKEFRLTRNLPIIVEIPDKTGHMADHVDFISYLIKRVVGIDIGKKEE